MYVVLVGAPGAGKGTQAKVLAEQMGLAPVASGDLFRQAQRDGTELGKLAASYMEKGLLVPDEVTIKVILKRLGEPDAAGGAILDGFPRNLEQARALDGALVAGGRAVNKVLYMKVSREELVKRLSGRLLCRACQTPYHIREVAPKVPGRCDRCGGELYQRADDAEATVRQRLEVYFAETVPLLDYYAGQGKLREVNGEGSLAQVSRALLSALKDNGGA